MPYVGDKLGMFAFMLVQQAMLLGLGASYGLSNTQWFYMFLAFNTLISALNIFLLPSYLRFFSACIFLGCLVGFGAVDASDFPVFAVAMSIMIFFTSLICFGGGSWWQMEWTHGDGDQHILCNKSLFAVPMVALMINGHSIPAASTLAVYTAFVAPHIAEPVLFSIHPAQEIEAGKNHTVFVGRFIPGTRVTMKTALGAYSFLA